MKKETGQMMSDTLLEGGGVLAVELDDAGGLQVK